MGTIKSAKLAMGYVSYKVALERRCKRCRYQTWAANARGARLPYCRMGGFFVWPDAGCERFGAKEGGDVQA